MFCLCFTTALDPDMKISKKTLNPLFTIMPDMVCFKSTTHLFSLGQLWMNKFTIKYTGAIGRRSQQIQYKHYLQLIIERQPSAITTTVMFTV